MAAIDPFHLHRFLDAQDSTFDRALSELRAGSKQTHWMWFVFPQIAGLGRSPTAMFYAIRSLDEGRAYLDHPVLGPRLRHSVQALMTWAARRTAQEILGPVDAMKLRSSLTLFRAVEPAGLFDNALHAFFPAPDQHTLALLSQSG